MVWITVRINSNILHCVMVGCQSKIVVVVVVRVKQMLVKKHSALDLLLYGSITIAFKVTITNRIKSLDPDSGRVCLLHCVSPT